ncbi:MAG: hypothetical protein CL910_18345 [Deltaproteobacteria bacterium]|jgi:hypothetical protein|nr:hypothetical protein [Deltaproteobacteria bacterium]
MRNFLAILALSLVIGLPALAGMVKYRTQDGKTGYASPDRVPAGAVVLSQDYEPVGSLTKGNLHYAPKPARAATPTRVATPDKSAEERRQELARDRWARRAEKANKELADAERDHERWRIRCRGEVERRSLYERPAGCSSYEQGQLDTAEKKLEEARAWAEDGLYDSCRKASDCLPGYIR